MEPFHYLRIVSNSCDKFRIEHKLAIQVSINRVVILFKNMELLYFVASGKVFSKHESVFLLQKCLKISFARYFIFAVKKKLYTLNQYIRSQYASLILYDL